MNCPRCGAPLRPEGPGRRWLQYFECDECWLAFELLVERRWAACANNPRARFIRNIATLQPGRTPRVSRFVPVLLMLLASLLCSPTHAQERTTYAVSFHIVRGVILFDGQLNGHPATFLLDNFLQGSDDRTLKRRFVKRAYPNTKY